MITKESIEFIDENLKYSIKEYLPLDDKILFYDALIFLSIVSKTKMMCSSSDVESFMSLKDNCEKAEIPLATYISCAYNYISKYSTPGHRLNFGYFLSDSVIDYCATRLESSTSDSLFLEIIKSDLLTTEKKIRDYMIEKDIAYEVAFSFFLKRNQISSYFIAYKKYCNSSLVSWYSSEYINKLVHTLEPFFTYILAKNQIFTPHKITSWNNSKIEDFSFCPIFFKDRYITNELVESSLGNEATTQGTKVHGIFEDILTKYKKSKRKNLPAIAARHFQSNQGISLQKELPEHTEFIKSSLEDPTSFLVEKVYDASEILIEHNMTATIGSVSFVGTADLILVKDTSAIIIDYKTSKLDPKYLPKNNQKYSKQLSLYAKLLQATRPEITSVSAYVIYTRGLIQEIPLNDIIALERTKDIDHIKKSLKSGVLIPNTQSCFLCRHPNCKFRTRESIWDANGNKKIRN